MKKIILVLSAFGLTANLIAQEAVPTEATITDETPLREFKERIYSAVKKNEPRLLLQLINQMVNYLKDKDGNTPLHFAVLNENPKMVKYLLSVNRLLGLIKNNQGKTAVDLAIESPMSLDKKCNILHAFEVVEIIDEELYEDLCEIGE